MMASGSLETPIGWLEVTTSHRGVTSVHFLDERVAPTRYCQPNAAGELLSTARRELREFFDGKRTTFSVPLAPDGTAFELLVLRALLRVPFATTDTYGHVAEAVGRPGGAQAIGQAVGKNPIGIFVPCHRVVAAEGIGGYGWGVDRKRWLLDLEARFARAARNIQEERSGHPVTAGAFK
jgi:methylated-DNA-[protein]-cysteine S-methyltransferase